MNCRDVEGRLSGWIDGELSSSDRRAVADHLSECELCRDCEAGLKEVVEGLAGLPRESPPSRDLWPSIGARLERGRRLPRGWAALATASAVLLVVGGGAFIVLEDRHGHPSPAATERVTSTYRGVEAEYERAADDLMGTLSAERVELPPAAVESVQRSLATIDETLRELRAALQKDPADPRLMRLLQLTHSQKLELLRRLAHASAARG